MNAHVAVGICVVLTILIFAIELLCVYKLKRSIIYKSKLESELENTWECEESEEVHAKHQATY